MHFWYSVTQMLYEIVGLPCVESVTIFFNMPQSYQFAVSDVVAPW
uniref:Uncharacterized protein n=1 Tax=Arundo donax TaxID=35708 RepID=A0A0A8XTF5_ARUDO